VALTDDIRVSAPFNADFTDKSGNGNDFTVKNNISIDTVVKKIGAASALSAGGIGEAAYSPTLNASYITVATWFKSTTTGTFIIAERSNGTFGNNDWSLLNLTNKIRFGCYVGGAFKFVDNPASIGDGNWHLLVGTYDGAYVRLFVDNVYVAETVAAQGPFAASTDPLTIFDRGPFSTPAGLTWGGNLDSFMFWGVAQDFGAVSVGQQATGSVAEIWNGGAGVEIEVDAAGNINRKIGRGLNRGLGRGL
jgi:hypothetical protein